MSEPVPAATPAATTPRKRMRYRIRNGVILTLLGALVFAIGAKPEWFGWDRSLTIGFVQITIFLIGLGLITLGGYIALAALWGERQRSILADLGLRLAATGFVVAGFAAMADVFGLGRQTVGQRLPVFGPLQAIGMLIGQGLIAAGFLMMLPYGRSPAPEQKND